MLQSSSWRTPYIFIDRLPTGVASITSLSKVTQTPSQYSGAFAKGLNEHVKTSRWSHVLQILSSMLRGSKKIDVSFYNSAIASCSRASVFHVALELLHNMKIHHQRPNIVSYGAAISACEAGGRWSLALELVKDIDAAGLRRNLIVLSGAVSACEKAARWREAMHLFTTVCRSSLRLDSIFFNATMSTCEKGSRWILALMLLSEMRNWFVEPDFISYSVATSACEKASAWYAAIDLASRTMNLVSCNVAMSACARAAQWAAAIEMMSSMLSHCIRLDGVSYLTSMRTLKEAALWQDSLQLMLQLGQSSASPRLLDWFKLLESCADQHIDVNRFIAQHHWGDGYRILLRQKGVDQIAAIASLAYCHGPLRNHTDKLLSRYVIPFLVILMGRARELQVSGMSSINFSTLDAYVGRWVIATSIVRTADDSMAFGAGSWVARARNSLHRSMQNAFWFPLVREPMSQTSMSWLCYVLRSSRRSWKLTDLGEMCSAPSSNRKNCMQRTLQFSGDVKEIGKVDRSSLIKQTLSVSSMSTQRQNKTLKKQ